MARSARAPLMRTKVWIRWLMGCLFAVWSELTLIREKFMGHPRFVYMLPNRHYAGYGCNNIGIRYSEQISIEFFVAKYDQVTWIIGDV